MGWGGYLVVVGGVFEQEDFFFISRRKKFRIWFFGGCRFFSFTAFLTDFLNFS